MHFRRGILASILFVYTGLVIFGVFHHEPWRDEAQVWLLARDLSIQDILKNAPYEGSPVLWHLLVAPFAKSGIPYGSQSILNLVIAVLALAVFLFFAPFSWPLKALFAFSFLMAFEYAVVARSYALSVLLLFLAAALDPVKTKRPVVYGTVIFCLFNTNAISLGPAAGLSVLFLFEAVSSRKNSRSHYIGFSLMVLGGVFAVLQLQLPPDSWKTAYFDRPNWQAAFKAVNNAFFSNGDLVPAFPRTIISCALLFLSLLGIMHLGRGLFYFLVSSLWLFYVFIFVYGGSLRHHGFLLIHLIVALWIGWSGRNEQRLRLWLQRIAVGALSIVMFISIPLTFRMYLNEYRYPFSGAREMALFIKVQGYEARPIIAHRPTVGSALLPYLPGKQFWYADKKGYGTYYKFDGHWLEQYSLPDEEVLQRAEKVFPKLSGVAILYSHELAPSLLRYYGLRLVHRTEGPVFGHGLERYWLYLANGN